MSQPQDESSPKSPISYTLDVGRKRARASTIELDVPRPEQSLERYTESRIQAGMEYATRRLESTTRKPSPNQEKLLVIYRLACEGFLNQSKAGFQHESKVQLLSEIRAYEEDISNHSWMKVTADEKKQEMRDEILKLRRFQYYARYGDYAQGIARELGDKTRVQDSEKREKLSGQFRWAEISEQIRKEEDHWETYGSGNGLEEIETSYAVWKGCHAAGVDFDQTVSAIHTYGARNTAVPSDLHDLVVEGYYCDIAMTLYKDLNDLTGTMPIDLLDHEMYMRATLVELREKWFQIDEDDTRRPFSWFPTQAFREEYRGYKKSTKEASRQKHEADVAHGAVIRLEELNGEEQLLQQLSIEPQANALPVPGPLPQGKKTKTSRAVSGGDRIRAWGIIKKVQEKAYSAYRPSLETQREVNRVVSQYRENCGESPPPQPSSSSGSASK